MEVFSSHLSVSIRNGSQWHVAMQESAGTKTVAVCKLWPVNIREDAFTLETVGSWLERRKPNHATTGKQSAREQQRLNSLLLDMIQTVDSVITSHT